MAPVRPNPTLSDDLISEILKRVPVKSLLCFQSVCKTWLSLIKHPAFVKSQLRHALTSETDQNLIMSRFLKSSAQESFSVLHVDSREIVADLKFPYAHRGLWDCRVVGSANGIVCVAVYCAYLKDKTDIYLKDKTDIYLWNPAIKRSKLIPSNIDFRSRYLGSLGFGYDPIDHDFKVVNVALQSLNAEVYSVTENVWRKMPDPIDIPLFNDFNVCVNGFLFAAGNYSMMTFDLNKEVLNCDIKLPVTPVDDEVWITEFNHSIAVIIWRDADKIDMWMLDDDSCLRGGGCEASWKPMFSIELCIELCMPPDIVFGYFRNRDLLVLNKSDDYMWISCNADEKEAKIAPLSVEMAGHHYGHDVYKYTESLVSLEGFKQINWNSDEDDN